MEIEATGLFTKETVKDPMGINGDKYAGLTVTYNPSTDKLSITAKEVDYSYAQDKGFNVLDVNGNIANSNRHFYTKDGKAIFASGLGCESRQLLQKCLRIAFPAGGNEASAGTLTSQQRTS